MTLCFETPVLTNILFVAAWSEKVWLFCRSIGIKHGQRIRPLYIENIRGCQPYQVYWGDGHEQNDKSISGSRFAKWGDFDMEISRSRAILKYWLGWKKKNIQDFNLPIFSSTGRLDNYPLPLLFRETVTFQIVEMFLACKNKFTSFSCYVIILQACQRWQTIWWNYIILNFLRWNIFWCHTGSFKLSVKNCPRFMEYL